jgi:NAD-dependent SIR2 family protein deacetylase
VKQVSDAALALGNFFRAHRRVLVITGAGCSTASGIVDYRDAHGEWKHAAPIMAQDFVDDETTRRRYWARSMRGWPMFARARPNPAHAALAALEKRDMLGGLITQNVDGLHQQAGHRELIELHGNLGWVVCMGCGERISREDVQAWLRQKNPHVLDIPASPAPDGDAELAVDLAKMRVPVCDHCGSMLKPDVVFFGESVPAARVQQAYELVDDAAAVLVVGSSLMVYSSYRFIRRARQRELPMAAVNQGKTRADDWWQLKVTQDCGTVLSQLLAQAD